jgi:hypothetical protein
MGQPALSDMEAGYTRIEILVDVDDDDDCLSTCSG